MFEQLFCSAMADIGLFFNGVPIPDGKFHHFGMNGGKNKSCWYILHIYNS
jgi:hypothetical protein